MKLAVVALAIVFVACAYAAVPSDPTFVEAFNNHYNWEVIFANNTSYLDEIDDHRGVIFVAGAGNVREIREEPFEISYRHSFFRTEHRFLDFKTFVHENITWVFGPTDPYAMRVNYVYHPVQIANQFEEDVTLFHHTQFASVSATHMGTHIVVYAAGWHLSDERANLTVHRMFLHPHHTRYHNGSFVSGNPFNVSNETDHVNLPDAGYIEYTRSHKPWIFHSSMRQYTIVVDPATQLIYKFHAPNDTNSSFVLLSHMRPSFSNSNISSAIFDHDTAMLYVGCREDGSRPGTIAAIYIGGEYDAMVSNFNIALSEWESNPRSLSLRDNFLFIGLNGGGDVLKLDVNLRKVVGFATLPFYIRDVSGIHAGRRHVYVVTNEQYAKVARTNNENFCTTPCDHFYGYCNSGKCACHPSHTLDSNGIKCNPNYVDVHPGRGGEIALGLLFAISFLVAIAGWFALWRTRQGLSVPFLGGGGNGRYSLANAEEKENFLGSD